MEIITVAQAKRAINEHLSSAFLAYDMPLITKYYQWECVNGGLPYSYCRYAMLAAFRELYAGE